MSGAREFLVDVESMSHGILHHHHHQRLQDTSTPHKHRFFTMENHIEVKMNVQSMLNNLPVHANDMP